MNNPPRLQRAQKDHFCCLCNRKIPKGHTYWRVLQEFGDRKEHTNCLLYEKEEQKK